MQLHKLTLPAYKLLRNAITAAGLAKPVRSVLGPMAGRITSRITGQPNRPSLVHGHWMTLAACGSYPPVAMAMDSYEEETTRLFESLIQPGMVVMDVGGHVGYFTLLAARQVGPTGKVFSFEPEPGNHNLLLENIHRNGYENIVVTRKAVSNQVGTMPLFLTALDNGRHSVYKHGLPERGRIDVEATTLDAFLESASWPHVDLIKVDAEGSEMDVLDGMDQLLVKSPVLKLIIEFSPTLLKNASRDPLQLLLRLNASGFALYSILEKRGPTTLPEEEWASLVDRLSKSVGSLNLLCIKQ